jgi:hypothetical protein
MKILQLIIVALALIACGESEPPVINTKQASDAELADYIAKNCQDKFKMHPFCIDANNEKVERTNSAMLKKKGVLTNMPSAAEVFGNPKKK